ncbi:glycosyltransferase family 2 protein [Algoriphagus aestuariicola]|uniref:Glycosyltransferase family 2 protein n=1 Tax=Algoriphagus aestuariicola TaxID=1852016 RepID=A0ABS3BT73_9BACT|nr:glycosyltransferase family A protein [Algoriphagus aestuariicola]MBN7801471.1 glycosyltransferase family 2 protein [Algoriphagus aestuariicola]
MRISSRVSIVIPNYNSAQFLSETLQSAMESFYPNLEIIVVDDGSNATKQLFKRTLVRPFPVPFAF